MENGPCHAFNIREVWSRGTTLRRYFLPLSKKKVETTDVSLCLYPKEEERGKGHKNAVSPRMMARSTECRKQLCLTQNPLFNDPPFLPFLAEEGGISWQVDTKEASGHGDGSWSQKIPNTSAAGAGRKPFRSRSGGNVGMARRRRRNYQASKDRRTSRRNFFMDLPPPSVGWSVCFLTTNVNQAQLSSCQGVVKKQKSMKRGWQGELACTRRLVRKLQHRSLRGNWGTE